MEPKNHYTDWTDAEIKRLIDDAADRNYRLGFQVAMTHIDTLIKVYRKEPKNKLIERIQTEIAEGLAALEQ